MVRKKEHKANLAACRYKNCDFSNEDATLLRAHVAAAHPGPLVCDDCGKQMRVESSLKGHRVMHEKPGWLRCPFCYEGFFRQDMLGTHIVSAHMPAVEVLIDFAVFHKHPAVMDLPVGQNATENELENQPGNQLESVHQSEPKHEPVPNPEDQLDPGAASMGSEPAAFDEPLPRVHPFYELLLACRADMED